MLVTGPMISASKPANAAAGDVYTLTIDGTINPVVYYKIKKSISLVEAKQGQCLILLVDTPGGLLVSTRKIVQEILNANVPVVCYVYPRAAQCASAGTFIALSCHILAMAPATNIGAAHPIEITGGADKTMMTKVVNDSVSFIRNICAQRGRNADWAEKAVRESVSITAEEAVKNNVADLVAKDVSDLLAHLDGMKITLPNGKKQVLAVKGIKPKEITENLGEKTLKVIGDPNLAYLLLMIGVLGIIIEFSHPGFAVPGVVGTICLILALFAFQTFTQNIAGMLLIITGLILFFLEAAHPGVGIFAVGGVISLALGSWMFFRSPANEFAPSLPLVISVYLVTVGLLFLVIYFIRHTRRRKIVTGREGLVGEIGRTVTALSPEGTVYVHGEYWKAVSRIPVEQNHNVRVLKVDGMKLEVEPVEDRGNSHGTG
jgi:membrane-bound serine protease (ClpP class)